MYEKIYEKIKEKLNKNIIKDEDRLSIPEIRHLLEITKLMAGAITRDEFTKIYGIYDDSIERLLKEN